MATEFRVLPSEEVRNFQALTRYTTMIRNHICLTGYSWKTSQFGLTIDTVTEFELVLPSGQVKTVTEKDEDLWFGLRVCPNQG